MYEYKCIEGHISTMGPELTRLSRQGWGLVGQPIPKNDYLVFATVRRVTVN